MRDKWSVSSSLVALLNVSVLAGIALYLSTLIPHSTIFFVAVLGLWVAFLMVSNREMSHLTERPEMDAALESIETAAAKQNLEVDRDIVTGAASSSADARLTEMFQLEPGAEDDVLTDELAEGDRRYTITARPSFAGGQRSYIRVEFPTGERWVLDLLDKPAKDSRGRIEAEQVVKDLARQAALADALPVVAVRVGKTLQYFKLRRPSTTLAEV